MIKRAALITAVLLSVCVVLAAPTGTAHAQDATLKGKGFFDVNVRAYPGVNGSAIGVLPSGTEFTAIGRTPGNTWLQIEFGGLTGWVAGWLVTLSGDTSVLPVTASVDPPLSGPPGPFDMLIPYNVNLRTSPSTSADVIMMMPYNNSAQAIGRNAGSSWVLVSYQGTEGWAAAWTVIVRGDIGHLPVDAGLPLPAPAPTPVPAPDDTEAPPSIAIPPGALAVRAPYRVNVRKAPNINADVTDVLPFGATIAATGRNAGNNWLFIEYPGGSGWVANWVVTVSDDTALLPILSDSEEVARIEGGIGVFGIFDMIVRSGPGVTYGNIIVLPATTRVPALARTADSSWVQISYESKQGWVASWLIVSSADINNLPVLEFGTP